MKTVITNARDPANRDFGPSVSLRVLLRFLDMINNSMEEVILVSQSEFISAQSGGKVAGMARSSRHSVPAYSIISRSYGDLGTLYQHTLKLCELEQCLVGHLEPPLSLHCRIANYSNNTLTLHTDSAAWAAKLRFITPDILKIMRDNCQLHGMKTVRIRVALPDTASVGSSRRMSMSQSSANHLEKVALSMSDEGMRNSLLRLSKHGS